MNLNHKAILVVVIMASLIFSCSENNQRDVPAAAEKDIDTSAESSIARRFLDSPLLTDKEIMSVIDTSFDEGVEVISMPHIDLTPSDARDASIGMKRIHGGGYEKRVWILEWQPGEMGQKSFVRIPSRAVAHARRTQSFNVILGNPNGRPISIALAAKVGPDLVFAQLTPSVIPPYGRSVPISFNLDGEIWETEASGWKPTAAIDLNEIKEMSLVVVHDAEAGVLVLDGIGQNVSGINQALLDDGGMPHAWPPRWANAHGQDIYGLWAILRHNEIDIRFRWVPPGRNVRGFWFAETEVTREQYNGVMLDPIANPSEEDARMPAQGVSWHQANRFCLFITDFGAPAIARLPRTVEWLHAGLADATQPHFASDGDIIDMGWTVENAGGVVQPVGLLAPNMWGIFDVHGNLTEWSSAQRGAGTQRWCYGGNVNRSQRASRIHSRWSAAAGNRFDRRGFRPLIEDPLEFRFGNQLVDSAIWLDHLQNGVWGIHDGQLNARPRGMVSRYEILPLIPSRPTIQGSVSFGPSEQTGPLILQMWDADHRLLQIHIDGHGGRASFHSSLLPNRLSESSAIEIAPLAVNGPTSFQVIVESENISLLVAGEEVLRHDLRLTLPLRFGVLNGAHQPITIQSLEIVPTM